MNLKKTVSIAMSALLATIFWSCGQTTNTSTTAVDSVVVHQDSVPVTAAVETGDPNVYEIPANYPWLLKLIGERLPWDSASECSRMTTYDEIFSEAKATKKQIEHNLIAQYDYKN